ncbi:heterokaryon incompatibility protein-domain-containing protein [Echria macrotheca]|uniref:Heterokaryon incompatibility protein-domain-containing protein n=1 Tax=Echria macrotheca TaxID=438768 RepID=A0AAJ0F6E1_9PEZI|nr:heterokaryon incompatibility protein-domain-containing protein [Echria macrotheca]
MAPGSFCSACAGITLKSLCHPDGYKHLSNAQDIFASAAGCQLCNLICEGIHQNTEIDRAQRETHVRDAINAEPIILFGRANTGDTPEDEPFDLIGIDVQVPVGDFFDIINLSLYAEPDSRAQRSGNIVGRALLRRADSPEAFSLVKDWYRTCVENHMDCRVLFANPSAHMAEDTPPPLPTRILDVGPPDGSAQPRLFVSNGATAPYAALSHCWGKHQIITTTKANFSAHRNTVPFSALSKTFQDAVTVVRQLGLRYIWIDSLCIIQDDADDWKRESAKMGRVYQDASITIAATGAKDGTAGCFIPRTFSLPRVEMPYRIDEASSSDAESMYLTLFPDRDLTSLESLEASPLGSRAWITQEWMLSRRTIHYTLGRMIWACRTLMEGEDRDHVAHMDEQRLLESVKLYGQSRDQDHEEEVAPDALEDRMGFVVDWCSLVSTYTWRKLTFESDKPAAIVGLAKEIEQGTEEVYTAGIFHPKSKQAASNNNASAMAEVWTRYLILQLFWFGKETLARPDVLATQPSWSWLSTSGPVGFHTPAQAAEPLVESMSIEVAASAADANQTSVAVVSVEARVRTVRLESYAFREYRWLEMGSTATSDLFQFHSRSTFLTGGAASIGKQVFRIFDEESRPVGWAAFDLGVVPRVPEIHVACFSVNRYNGEFDGFNVMFLSAVQPTGGRNMYERLGVGEVSREQWFDGLNHRTVVLGSP